MPLRLSVSRRPLWVFTFCRIIGDHVRTSALEQIAKNGSNVKGCRTVQRRLYRSRIQGTAAETASPTS
jgi:hypothetical protein